MYLIKNQFQLFLILSICLTVLKASSIKLADPLKKKPLSKEDLDFQPFALSLRFLNSEFDKDYQDRIIKIKKYLMKIPKILKNILLSKTITRKNINYDEKLIYNMRLRLTDEQRYHFIRETINTDLLVVVQFTFGNFFKIALSRIYYINGKYSDFILKQRSYILGLKINNNYENLTGATEDMFILSIINEIFTAIGFRYKYLLTNLIRNKFDNAPLYLVKDSKIYKSYQKYLNLSNTKVAQDLTNNKFYSSNWNISNFHDIMSEKIYPDTSITELTMKVINEMANFTVPKCDLFRFEGGLEYGFNCLRIGQDCIDTSMEKDYFLEYGIDNEAKIKCYLNNRDNIKNKQCGVRYGNLEKEIFNKYFCPVHKVIKDTPLISMSQIPELNIYKSQKIRLLKNPPSCKKGIPRTIFFSVPHDIFDKEKENTNIDILKKELEEINKDVQYEEIIFGEKEKKYFVTYQAYEENYSRESVIKVLNYSGVIRSYSPFNTHNLLIKNPTYGTLREMGMIPSLQKLFSYTNFKIITNKDLTYKYYAYMNKYYPNDYTYMPESYSYPEERRTINKKFSNYKLASDNLWLVKSKKGSLGDDIFIFRDLSKVPTDFIITRYIHNPHLINKLKYDFRLYVLITGLSPLKMYLYKEGMVRFTTAEYSLDLNKLDELYRHLTNVYINKKNKKTYKKAHDADTEEGSKWSLQVYENYCKHHGIDYGKIREQMIDISIKSILAVKDMFLNQLEENGTKNRNHFKLFGYDFLVDENLKVHLIEVNGRPSLLMGDINDLKLKPQLVADVLNLVGITPYSHDYRDDFEPYEKDSDNYSKYSKKEEIENNVNIALCEFGKPRGRFELIFPVKNKVEYYKKFFGRNRKTDELLWEKL